ncbi:MAG: LysM peptidoglycan-binding domain-containing protein [Candidatus Cloacimonetes bacterium]|nr:LysM peptidoglycan-binding domain-containing protein [Candidatus Cloacimonadota bacterium]
MKYLFKLLISLSILFGCSINKDIIEEPRNIEVNIDENYIPAKKDTLNRIVTEKNIEIDSLYSIIAELNFTVDSLTSALEISNSRVAVNPDFQIPDTITFAGRLFDLKNERIYSKFENIFKNELKPAHKFIPRSGKYFAIFDSVFSKYDIPLDTKYLAIAESRLSPMAGSRVGAVGIWQFMPKTAKGFGMKINSFVDQRREVFISTESAAKYLVNSYNYLSDRGSEDWLLAMSAYNAGAGSIARVMKRQGGNDFFDLLMRVDETHQYVWRAVAIKMIFENEEAIFGKKFERYPPLLKDAYRVKLKLKGHYKIDDWAKYQGTSIGKILELNPWIKIYKQSRKKYSAVNNVVLPPGEYQVLVPRGNNIDLEALAQLEKQFLKKNEGFFTHHVVKKGDTLYDIARKYKTTVSRIKNINGLRSNTIYPGQKLRLYSTSTGYSNKKSNNYYIVKKGDSVGVIAQKLKTSQKRIISMNNLKNKNGIVLIIPGQKLYY